MYRDLLCCLRKSLFLFLSRISSLSVFIRYLCCSLFSHFVPSFVSAYAALSGLGAPATLEREVFFTPIHFALHRPKQMRFLLIYSSLGYGTSVPTPRITADFAFPLFFLRFCGGVSWCVDSVFSPAVSTNGVHYRSIHMLAKPPSSFTR